MSTGHNSEPTEVFGVEYPNGHGGLVQQYSKHEALKAGSFLPFPQEHLIGAGDTRIKHMAESHFEAF